MWFGAARTADVGKVLQDAPARLQAQRDQDLRDGMLFPAQHHTSHPLHKAHRAWPGKDVGKGTQQQLPLCPELCGILHDALLPSVTLSGPRNQTDCLES